MPINVGSTLAGFTRFFFNESGDDPPLKRSVFYVQLAVVVCVCVLVSQGCVKKTKKKKDHTRNPNIKFEFLGR